MNARATLSNGRTAKENGGGTVAIRATQGNPGEELEDFKNVCEVQRQWPRECGAESPTQPTHAGTFIYIHLCVVPFALHCVQIGLHSAQCACALHMFISLLRGLHVEYKTRVKPEAESPLRSPRGRQDSKTGQILMAGSCGHKPSGSIKEGRFLIG
jgi:hypothetical protein